jgi:hypothetical protein
VWQAAPIAIGVFVLILFVSFLDQAKKEKI